MEIIDNRQGKRKGQVGYSSVIVISGVVFFILLVMILKIQQLRS
jgi:hypothetical protein